MDLKAKNDAFEWAFAFVAKWEGGWSNDAFDPGGETRYGISKAAYPDLDLSKLTLEDAKSIYRRDYWLAAKCDKLPEPLALVHFDAAVNQGVARAAMFLQWAVGTPADGIIGPKTLSAASEADTASAVTEYCARRARHYGNLSTFGHFGLGWMRRLFDCHREALMG